MIKNIMKNIGPKPAGVKDKEIKEKMDYIKSNYVPGNGQAGINFLMEQANHLKNMGAEKEFQEVIGMINKEEAGEEENPKTKLFDEYKLPTKEAILKRNEFLKSKNIDPNTPEKMKNKEFDTLAKELDDALGIGDISLAQELLINDEDEEAK